MGIFSRLGIDPARDFAITSAPGARAYPAEVVSTEVVAAEVPSAPMDGMNMNRFRRKRFGRFTDHVRQCFPAGRKVSVIDIGGVVDYWQATRDLWGGLNLDITVVNLDAPEEDHGAIRVRPGNACDLAQFGDNAFDMVHSNSVIEHVGVWTNMMRMAQEIRRVAPHYFVQTPNFGFPVEPHFRSLFFHWYPEITRAKMMMRRPRGFGDRKVTLDDAMQQIQANCLLNADQMRALFPNAGIEFERVYGLKKSIMAIA
ncbi:methyltransferase family protein [Novosphingobium sp. PhB165]|uniref:methyltransferase domain-containing protein n=1 Tax=Novosphingobium sp. PhB165 TaxID=2485105 RepID=UPI0010E6DB3E|nr:class I SAM-dependent methyltransferase [Novosphingobium sp. PhB165]TCM17865.1 methyltransferase family protein [Novosphingobium sp. PhB165]